MPILPLTIQNESGGGEGGEDQNACHHEFDGAVVAGLGGDGRVNGGVLHPQKYTFAARIKAIVRAESLAATPPFPEKPETQTPA